jgi:hypothetical protein
MRQVEVRLAPLKEAPDEGVSTTLVEINDVACELE